MAELDIESGLAVLLARAADAMKAAVTEGPAARSQELVPRDTDTLADSMRISDPVIDGTTATVVLSYGQPDDSNPKSGGPSADYAVTVHERLDVPHATGQAKYLENAQLEAATGFTAAIAAKMK